MKYRLEDTSGFNRGDFESLHETEDYVLEFGKEYFQRMDFDEILHAMELSIVAIYSTGREKVLNI